MADETTDDSQKTEEPTPKKLEESRKKGQVPLSREMNNWVMLLAGTIVVVAMSGTVMSDLGVFWAMSLPIHTNCTVRRVELVKFWVICFWMSFLFWGFPSCS